LTFKEPIMAVRLAENNVTMTMVAILLSIDTVAYTICSFILGILPQATDGNYYTKLMYLGSLIYVLSMLMQGPAPFLPK
jgi:hypothetical protein